jgi:hypothetical protein
LSPSTDRRPDREALGRILPASLPSFAYCSTNSAVITGKVSLTAFAGLLALLRGCLVALTF